MVTNMLLLNEKRKRNLRQRKYENYKDRASKANSMNNSMEDSNSNIKNPAKFF